MEVLFGSNHFVGLAPTTQMGAVLFGQHLSLGQSWLCGTRLWLILILLLPRHTDSSVLQTLKQL